MLREQIGHNNCHLFSQWPTVHPEDSGVYICQAENNEGVTEVKVEVVVEGGLGAPVASVSATEMTVVEGQTVTFECQASGKVFACLCVLMYLTSALTSHFSLHPLFPFALQAPLFLSSPGPSSGHHCRGNTQWLVEF